MIDSGKYYAVDDAESEYNGRTVLAMYATQDGRVACLMSGKQVFIKRTSLTKIKNVKLKGNEND